LFFFLLTLSVAVFLFIRGTNSVSGNNIDIQVEGPSTIGGGESLSLDVVIKNNNNVDLESGSLSVVYPEGTRSSEDMNAPLVREKQDVGALPAKRETRKTIKAVLFGEKDSARQIKMTFEYRLKGSSAIFYKEKMYDLVIKSSPIIVTVENPTEVNSNQRVSFVVTLSSNSAEILRDVLLKVEYPFGFAYQDADVKPTDNTGTLWNIGDLGTSAQKKITIQGILQGQNEEERTFRFSTGIRNPEKNGDLGAIFSVIPQTIKIKKPFLGVTVTTDGSSQQDVVARPGGRMQTSVSWKNNLPNKLVNAQVLVKFSGSLLDKNSVNSIGGGFYRSIDNTIVFDKNNTDNFISFDPGQSSSVSFEFAPNSVIPTGSNQTLSFSVTVSGDQAFDNGKQETISTTVNKTVKIASQVNVRSLVTRSLGAFENSGPMPLRVDNPTTYTIQLVATNSQNTVQKTKVTAILPSYVVWTGLSSPGVELISFDEGSRTVTWNVGELKGGTGFSLAPRAAEFQVSITPSITQAGTAPTLVFAPILTGVDTFVNKTVSAEAGDLSTRYATDPDFRDEDEMVVK